MPDRIFATRDYVDSVAGAAETDPVFSASPASGIVSGDITNWNTAFGWGDHAGLYANASHTHTEAQITDLQDYLLATDSPTVSGTWTFSGPINVTGNNIDFAYGIHGGYADAATTAFGATIWALDASWTGAAAGTNSASTSAYGIRWLRSTHTDVVSVVGEGLYAMTAGVVRSAMGESGIYTTGALNIGGAADATLTRAAAGNLEVEGRPLVAHNDGALTSGRIRIQNGGSPSGGANGDIWLIY